MKKILLVDDEVDILEFLKYNLEKDNFEVLVSSNGKDALKKNYAESRSDSFRYYDA
jgi:two-component system, OmpR family, alkaline phosphatase synthesis response regulator PhoP